jgi:DDE superfamily endonuclease
MAVRGGGIFEQRAAVLARLQEGPGEAARQAVAVAPSGPAPSRWTLRTIRATVDWLQPYSLSGVWRVLTGLDLRLRSAQVQQYSPDPAYAVKEARLHVCLQEAAAAPAEVVAVFLDEMGYYRWPAPAPDWGPAAPAPPGRRQTVGTNSQWRIVGALNALTGQVNYLDNYIVGRQQLVRFYGQLAASYAGARRLYVIQDNWSVHEHPDVQGALATWPQLEVVRLPTYAPWLNPIEKLWRWLRQDVLKLHRLAAQPTALRQRVRDWLDQFATGSHELLQYVGLRGDGRLAQALHPT